MGIIGKYRLFYDNNKTIFVTIFKAAVFFFFYESFHSLGRFLKFLIFLSFTFFLNFCHGIFLPFHFFGFFLFFVRRICFVTQKLVNKVFHIKYNMQIKILTQYDKYLICIQFTFKPFSDRSLILTSKVFYLETKLWLKKFFLLSDFDHQIIKMEKHIYESICPLKKISCYLLSVSFEFL